MCLGLDKLRRVWGCFLCGAVHLNCTEPVDNKMPPNASVYRYMCSSTESCGYVAENDEKLMKLLTCVIRRKTGTVEPRENCSQLFMLVGVCP